MNEFWFLVGVFGFTVVMAGGWCITKTLFFRWLNNDWCRHEWDMWSGVDKETMMQYRFCRKCNKAERRTP